jgi:hypothetical protein
MAQIERKEPQGIPLYPYTLLASIAFDGEFLHWGDFGRIYFKRIIVDGC